MSGIALTDLQTVFLPNISEPTRSGEIAYVVPADEWSVLRLGK